MEYSFLFYCYSTILFLCPFGCFLLIIFQLISTKSLKIEDKKTALLIYSVYASGAICGAIGYSLHLSKTHRVWCEIYGLSVCFAFYGGSKALVYSFFLRRARLAAGMIINKCLKIFFKYIGPVFLIIYWLIYCGVTSFFFSGGQTMVDQDGIISFCVVDDWKLWFVIFAGCVDIFNCLGSLTLFLFPLIKSMHQLRQNDHIKHIKEMVERSKNIDHHIVDNTATLELVNAMKWNVVLTGISSLSSVIGVLSIPYMHDYVWLVCLVDPFINALCIFFMMKSNRICCKYICLCQCFINHHHHEDDIPHTSPQMVDNMSSTVDIPHTSPQMVPNMSSTPQMIHNMSSTLDIPHTSTVNATTTTITTTKQTCTVKIEVQADGQ